MLFEPTPVTLPTHVTLHFLCNLSNALTESQTVREFEAWLKNNLRDRVRLEATLHPSRPLPLACASCPCRSGYRVNQTATNKVCQGMRTTEYVTQSSGSVRVIQKRVTSQTLLVSM